MNKQPALPVRVRIAPSPTGRLHVGTARAALFNELFARHHHGKFIVRIEDTDPARSKKQYEQDILEGLAWLGLTWDEGPDIGGPYGPYRQSERVDLYRQAISQLLDSGRAYLDPSGGTVIRLRVKAGDISFTDLIRGWVRIHSDSWGGDFIIARSVDEPLYHLAVVVDDAAMAISHVIRGEDHLTNTAKHILLQRALGLRQPHYAHLPLLLDEQRRKLSKRAGDVSLLSYRDQGYLAEAMCNYLALLGWNPKGDREFFTHQELAAAFSLDGIQKGGAIFSLDKLAAFNKHYLRGLPPAELLQRATPWLTAAGYVIDDPGYWQAAVATEQQRITTLKDLPAALQFFRPDWQPTYQPLLLVWKTSQPPEARTRLEKLVAVLQDLPDSQFVTDKLQEKILAWIDDNNLGRGEVLWPMRVAITGQEHSPGPFEVAAVLGKKKTLERLQYAITKLRT